MREVGVSKVDEVNGRGAHAANIDSCSPVPATRTLKCVGSFGFILQREMRGRGRRFRDERRR